MEIKDFETRDLVVFFLTVNSLCVETEWGWTLFLGDWEGYCSLVMVLTLWDLVCSFLWTDGLISRLIKFIYSDFLPISLS